MALIGKIRKQSGLLIIFIGVAMAAFVLGDIFRGTGGGRGEIPQDSVGTVYGKQIPREIYESRVDEAISNRKEAGQEVTSQMRQQIREQVWNNMVRERVMQRQIENLGLSIPKQEFRDLIAGDNVHPRIKQIPAFQNQQTGQFDKNLVLQRLKQGMQDPQFKRQWMRIEQELKKDQKISKYNSLIQKGLYANSIEAKRQFINENKEVDIQFVLKTFRDIPDSEIEYSDKDIQSYYQEHKDEGQYQQERSRTFEYIVFNIAPSSSDSAQIREDLEAVIPIFKEREKDSLFAINNSSNRQRRFLSYYRVDELNPVVDTAIMESDSGDVVGPYVDREAEAYKVSKVKGFKTMPDSVKARHILIQKQRGRNMDSIRNVLDSLRTQLANGMADFASLAQQMSEDQSARNGGELGWFGPRQMVKSFTEACFNGEQGDLTVVESRFGIHLIEILEQTEPEKHVQLLTIDRSIQPSKETLNGIYDKASSFAINNETSKAFDQAAKEKGYRKLLADKVKEDAQTISRLPDSRKLVKWAYTSELGTVSEPFRCGDQYVISHLTEIRKEGTPDLETIRDEIEREVIREKKANKYKKIMAKGENLKEVASEIGGEVKTARGITFNSSSIDGGGANEPRVIGKIMTLEKGFLSKPLKGHAGIYVVAATEIHKAGEPGPGELTAARQTLTRQMRSRTRFAVYEALKELADVEDNRFRIRDLKD